MSIVAIGMGILLTACTSHKVSVDPIEVKPIHVTMDINLKIQRELDDFFEFQEEIEAEMEKKQVSNEAAEKAGTTGDPASSNPPRNRDD